ncbi:hypothetical protein A33Q_2774 [Indibacter alkaliphilus LW1]|uniref:Uncharacterized protein n=1 Tax=Indibacter alkaliphilus (strain CCUG 57479 / KCTC 22604 / LW1) TaxID=1189612 RepID=S2D871_INDAL|nr:hypothetical protein A33Q_2774 [Indibacter alkaliphilus LW1]
MKAIHNRIRDEDVYFSAVIPLGRYQFESNSQRNFPASLSLLGCDSLGKISI